MFLEEKEEIMNKCGKGEDAPDKTMMPTEEQFRGIMIDTIIKMITKFEKINAKKPTAIYLGHEEIMALKNWSDFSSHQDPSKPLDRTKFYGIDVCEVDDNNHICVG